ncbi:MAG: AAA family ATPase [Alphaproteobacteria bacterium]
MTNATPHFKIPEAELQGLIHRYTRDITAQDRQGKFDPITGRDQEVDTMILILLQRLRKNVLLMGGAGVGKTACFIALAQLVNAGKVPDMIKDAQVLEIEMSVVGAGTQSRSDLEGRLVPIVAGIAERNASRTRPPTIICFDEVHQLMLGFKQSASCGVMDLLKPYLTAGDLFIIGATTREEYEDYVKTDPAIDRRFQKIMLDVPDLKQTYNILLKIKGNFEKHYSITVSNECCERIVRLADKFLRNRNNPDKSILALDQACARAVKDGLKDLDFPSIEAAVARDAGIDPLALNNQSSGAQ